eukprot:5177508-Pyramimonas_sp.AAC.1
MLPHLLPLRSPRQDAGVAKLTPGESLPSFSHYGVDGEECPILTDEEVENVEEVAYNVSSSIARPSSSGSYD